MSCSIACILNYLLGAIVAAILLNPIRAWKEGYSAAKDFYKDYEKGFHNGWDSAKELFQDYNQGFGTGFEAGWDAALEGREDESSN